MWLKTPVIFLSGIQRANWWNACFQLTGMMGIIVHIHKFICFINCVEPAVNAWRWYAYNSVRRQLRRWARPSAIAATLFSTLMRTGTLSLTSNILRWALQNRNEFRLAIFLFFGMEVTTIVHGVGVDFHSFLKFHVKLNAFLMMITPPGVTSDAKCSKLWRNASECRKYLNDRHYRRDNTI